MKFVALCATLMVAVFSAIFFRQGDVAEVTAAPVAQRPTASTAIVSKGETFTCTPTQVWDGDGPIWCGEGPKIRLAGIAAREMNGSCSDGHPCPSASATEARDHLVELLGGPVGTASTGHILVNGPALTCSSDGSGKGSRTAAWCVSPTTGDLNCKMTASGYALRWDRYWRGHHC